MAAEKVVQVSDDERLSAIDAIVQAFGLWYLAVSSDDSYQSIIRGFGLQRLMEAQVSDTSCRSQDLF